MSERNKRIGDKLKELRLKNGYTQVSLSKELNIPSGTYVNYELGKRTVPDELKEKIAIVYKKSIIDIFFS